MTVESHQHSPRVAAVFLPNRTVKPSHLCVGIYKVRYREAAELYVFTVVPAAQQVFEVDEQRLMQPVAVQCPLAAK